VLLLLGRRRCWQCGQLQLLLLLLPGAVWGTAGALTGCRWRAMHGWQQCTGLLVHPVLLLLPLVLLLQLPLLLCCCCQLNRYDVICLALPADLLHVCQCAVVVDMQQVDCLLPYLEAAQVGQGSGGGQTAAAAAAAAAATAAAEAVLSGFVARCVLLGGMQDFGDRMRGVTTTVTNTE
jgi:hypothetical protein